MKIKKKFTMWVNKNQINIGIAELKGLILFEFILNFLEFIISPLGVVSEEDR